MVGYYRTPESRLAYRLLLGGTKHFGYYPEGACRLSMAAAMRRMEDKLGEALALPPGSRVLDAGCGEGDVAIRLRTRFGLEVDGVDLLQPNLRRARAKVARLGLAGSLRFHRLNYGDLPFGDRSFDGAYTMETLVHAFDHRQALRELGRVLKPGGALALFEYSVPPRSQMTPGAAGGLRLRGRAVGYAQPARLRPRRVPGDPGRGRVRGRGHRGRHRADLADAPAAGAHLLPCPPRRVGCWAPGRHCSTARPWSRALPPPGGLALQRRPRPTRWAG